MRVLMLGWEYPPNITGGLGTACEGLSQALAKLNFDIQFVIPKVFGDENATHMRLSEPVVNQVQMMNSFSQSTVVQDPVSKEKKVVSQKIIPSFLTPYLNPQQYERKWEVVSEKQLKIYENYLIQFLKSVGIHHQEKSLSSHYGLNLFDEVENFARRVLAWVSTGVQFDIIHAHDWMTYSAGVLIKELTGCPLIVHVHSLEHDRSGDYGNLRIMGLESLGMQKADRVIAVSHLTKSRIVEKYQIPEAKIGVVHNGMSLSRLDKLQGLNQEIPSSAKVEFKKDQAKKYVLFLGRVTFQKGPDYFVKAAQKVIPAVPNVVFVFAGAGDMLPAIKSLVKELQLEKYFEFRGFLKGDQVDAAYAMADLFVMPSVSEPFGIAPLEAVCCNTPVLISRQSGVSEVLSHALKTNFWDVDELANMIVGALKYPELRSDLMKMAQQEVMHITWDSAALKVSEHYLSLF